MSDNIRVKYEEAFSKYVGALGARAFSRGREGLVILLKALGVNKGDRIGVCGFTCLAVVEAVKFCGAIPVYLDVDEHLCMDPLEILRQKPGSLKVVILQHTFGIPGQLEQLLSACQKIGTTLVEDCAHSLDCFWKGEPLGKFGAGAIYSFEWGKAYSTGQGGMLTVNSQSLLDEVDRQTERLALPASAKSELLLECDRRVYSFLDGLILKRHTRYVYNKLRNVNLVGGFLLPKDGFCLYRGYVRLAGKMTAKAGLKQLANWPSLKQLRRENTKMIEERLSKAGLAFWPKPAEADVTMLRYPVFTEHRSKILKQSGRLDLDISGLYASPVNPLQGDDLAKVDYHIGSCQKSEYMIKRLVYLPTGLTLSKQSLEAIMRVICSN
jgi:dTDP-4-amino-4,6-dideoxygalactose transaminase